MRENAMSLKSRKDLKSRLDDTLSGRVVLEHPLPKYRFPSHEGQPAEIYQVVSDELYLDGNARQNLATFCQTWEEPELHRLMEQSIDKNMIDRTEYPQTAEIEIRCAQMLADLWNAPADANPIGTSTVGSSEACMLAGMAAKWRWKARRKAEGKPTDKPNLVCGPVQVCWDKFCVYWEIEKREIPMRPGSYRMDAESMLKAVDENTIAVVPTLGVTYTGQYEFVEPMAAALDQLQDQTGLDIDIHVDGASGAFLAPFTAPQMVWDFRLPRVKSISTSGHKYGLAPVGVGWVVWRDAIDLPSELVFSVPYLGGSVGTFGINFSRPAGQVIAQYYNFLRLGRAGYRRVHKTCYDTTRWLSHEIARLGPFDFICDGDPANSIPAVCFTIRPGVDCPYTLYDLSDQLTRRGWQVPAFPLSGEAKDMTVMRIMVRQGVSRDMATLLVKDFERAIAHFDAHPIIVPLTEHDVAVHNHT
jgi:glutamate decarboxylase